MASLTSGDLAVLLEGLGTDFHYEQMGRGVIVSENIYYFLGMILTFLVCSWVLINRDE